MFKRIFSLLLAVCLIFALLPGVLPQAEAAMSFSQKNSSARASIPLTTWEFEVLRQTNKERIAGGLKPLTAFDGIQSACDVRAEELVSKFSHTRPDGNTCWTALKEAGVGYSRAAENIAAGYFSPEAAVTGWMNSEGHRDNIMNEALNHMGVGHYYQAGSDYSHYWVQMFVSHSDESYTAASVFIPTGEKTGTGIDDMYMYAVLYNSVYGDCYLPISSELVTGYDPEKEGTQSIRLEFLGFAGSVDITLAGEPEPPAAPTVKISGNTATGKPKVSWEAVEGADLYRVYRATSKSGSYTRVKSTSSLSFTDTTAEAGTNYYYKVKAANKESGLASSWSNVVNRVCDLAKPVVTLKVDTASGKPKVTFEKISGAEKYYIVRSTEKDGTYSKLATVTGTSYIDTTAEAGTNYYYKVKALHAKDAADSAYSAVTNRVCDLAKPVVSISLTSAGAPRVRWQTVEGAVKYEIYRADSKDGDYTKVKTAVTARSYTDTAAASGETWYYKVKAIHSNSAANSAFSSVKYITAE